MEEAIAQITQWQTQFDDLALSQALMLQPGETVQLSDEVRGKYVRLWAEVRNLLAIASLILKSAAFRTESRGGHYRSDYPIPSDQWLGHTMILGNKMALQILSESK